MNQINFENISYIKKQIQLKLLGESINNHMISLYAVEFKRYIHSWFKNGTSWEEFSSKSHLFEDISYSEIDTKILDIITEKFYYNTYQTDELFIILKSLNNFEKKIKKLVFIKKNIKKVA